MNLKQMKIGDSRLVTAAYSEEQIRSAIRHAIGDAHADIPDLEKKVKHAATEIVKAMKKAEQELDAVGHKLGFKIDGGEWDTLRDVIGETMWQPSHPLHKI